MRVRPRWQVVLLVAGLAALIGGGLWSVLAPEHPTEWFAAETPDKTPGGTLGGPLGETPAAGGATTPPLSSAGNESPREPSFDVVRVSRGGTGVIAGRAAPGASVGILADAAVMAEVQADPRGDWALIFDNPLKTGATRLSLKARAADGRTTLSRDEVIISVPGMEGEPGQETFIDPLDEGVVAVRLARDSGGRSEILQRPGVSPDYAAEVALDAVDYDAAGAAVLTGHAAARHVVEIYLDNAFLAEARADDHGGWTVAAPAPIDDGSHRLRLDQLDDKREITARFETPLSLPRAPAAKALEAGYAVIESKGPSGRLWRIARKLPDGTAAYVLVIGFDRSQITDIKTVHPGQRAVPTPEARKK